jgi:hypothetical protein
VISSDLALTRELPLKKETPMEWLAGWCGESRKWVEKRERRGAVGRRNGQWKGQGELMMGWGVMLEASDMRVWHG